MAEKNDDEFLVKQFSQGARAKPWTGSSRLSDGAEGLDGIKPPFGRAAFDRIVEQYSADIAVLANRLLGWPGDVEDVVQDIFLAVFVGLKKFRGECSLRSWLFTITINKCRTYRYKRMLRLKIFSKVTGKMPRAHTYGADGQLMDNETFNRVRHAVTDLPAKYREPIVLRYLQELSINESSRILGISENTLQVRLNRARGRLRQKLAELIKE